jgi:hypothetical protein
MSLQLRSENGKEAVPCGGAREARLFAVEALGYDALMWS